LSSYYLDTSAHVERWFGAASSQGRVAEALQGNGPHSTSTHALREWKHIVDESAGDILNTLVSDNPEDDFPRFLQGYGREPNRRILVLFSLLRGARGGDWTKDELRLRARHMLDFRSEQMFRKDMAAIHSSSRCGLAENEVAPDQGGIYALKSTCKKSEDICRQPDAIEDEVDRWTAGAKALKQSSAHEAMGETALKMASSRNERKGRNCYAKTGDLAVAMDCPEGETLLTTDRSFEVMESAIERDVLRLAPTEGPPKGKAA
jgi:hypothetical protein